VLDAAYERITTGWRSNGTSSTSSSSPASKGGQQGGGNGGERLAVLDENDLRELTRAVVAVLTTTIVGSVDKRNMAGAPPQPMGKSPRNKGGKKGKGGKGGSEGRFASSGGAEGGPGGARVVLPVGQVLLGTPLLRVPLVRLLGSLLVWPDSQVGHPAALAVRFGSHLFANLTSRAAVVCRRSARQRCSTASWCARLRGASSGSHCLGSCSRFACRR